MQICEEKIFKKLSTAPTEIQAGGMMNIMQMNSRSDRAQYIKPFAHSDDLPVIH